MPDRRGACSPARGRGGATWAGLPSAKCRSVRPSCPPSQLIITGLQSGQWGRKKAAAAAVGRVCQAAGDALGPQAAALLDALLKVGRPLGFGGEALQGRKARLLYCHLVRPLAAAGPAPPSCRPALPARLPLRAPTLLARPPAWVQVQEARGRIWEGKEAVLSALGSLAAACPSALQPDQRRRLVAALLDAAGKKKSAYRKEALAQLEGALLALGGGTAAAGGASGGGGADEGDYWAAASPLLLELAGSFVEAAQGGAAMETDQPKGGSSGVGGAADDEPHPGKAVPAAQVAACLGAAFATAAPATARQHADIAAAALTALLGAAGRAGDQLAVVAAGCRLAEHAARVAAGPGGPAPSAQQAQQAEAREAGPVLSPAQPGVAALLQAALQLAGEGKVSQLREECLRLR